MGELVDNSSPDAFDLSIGNTRTTLQRKLRELILNLGNFLPGSVVVIKLSWLAPLVFEKDLQTRQFTFPALKMVFR